MVGCPSVCPSIDNGSDVQAIRYLPAIDQYLLLVALLASIMASQLMTVTNGERHRQTDIRRPRHICSNRPHLCNASVKLLREETCSEVKVTVRESTESVLREEESLR